MSEMKRKEDWPLSGKPVAIADMAEAVVFPENNGDPIPCSCNFAPTSGLPPLLYYVAVCGGYAEPGKAKCECVD